MVYEWAGVPFLVVGHHEGRFIRAPGLWGFARRGPRDEHTLLFLDHADAINETAGPGHTKWAEAMALGMDELHVCLNAKVRIDRLQLRSRIVQRVGPLLNVLDAAAPAPSPADLPVRAIKAS